VVDNAPIEERKSEAFCLMPSLTPDATPEEKVKEDREDGKKPKEPVKIRIGKDKNGWLVDGATITQGATTTGIEVFAGLVRKHRPQIGQPGMTPAKISADMSPDFFAMIFSGKTR
jgi:hypothetical protein